MAELLPQIIAILRHIARDPDLDLTPATCLADLTGWDSMDLIAAVVEIEGRFKVAFTTVEIDRIVTLGDLVGALASKPSREAA